MNAPDDYHEQELRIARATNVELAAVIDRYRGALARIVAGEGMVCAEFMECTHVSCSSSYAAWAIADAALRGVDPDA